MKIWNRRELIFFLEQLEMYMSAGLTVNRSLRMTMECMKSRQKKSITRVLHDVESGISLSKSLTDHVGIPRMIAGLLEQGESSGELGRAALVSKQLLEKTDELIKKCLSAMMYPIVIGICALVLTIGLVRGIMPQIIPLLLSLHVKLPLLTIVVIRVSKFLMHYGIMLCVAVVVITVGVVFAYRKIPSFTNVVHVLIQNIPFVGRLVTVYATSVFIRSCGSLIESGVFVAHAYSKCVLSISWLPVKKIFSAFSADIDRGVSVSNAFSKARLPPYVGSIIRAGEISSALGISMIRTADILDRDIEHALKRLTALIEPVMVVGMGGIVGSIALSIMMPIYDISKVLQK